MTPSSTPQSDSLTRAFLEALEAAGVPPTYDPVALEAALQQLWEEAKARYPGVRLSATAFAAHLARCAGHDGLLPSNAEDVYLAAACSEGAPGALAELENLLQRVAPEIARFDPRRDFIDETLQLVRQALLVAPPGEIPRIASYLGQGKLLSWVKATAIRTALNLRRGPKHALDEDGAELLEGLISDEESPDLALLRRRHHRDFVDALREAVLALPARERTWLRLHFAEGMTVGQIGKLYGKDKSTISRWLTRARARVLEGAQQHLARRLQLSTSQLDSLIKLLSSEMDLSLRTLFETGKG